MELRKDMMWVGAKDANLRVFDIIMEANHGTTYNSYLIKGSEKTVLIETVKLNFWDEFYHSLLQYTDINDIDYIIVNHTEPDHAGSIEKLIRLNPNITIVGTTVALQFLKEIVNLDFKQMAVKSQDYLCLGNKTLYFEPLPNLHWPDSMYTYLKEDEVLFTCDSFGAHYCFDDILLSQLIDKEAYHKELQYYYQTILGPFPNFMRKAMEYVSALSIKMICPGHGPIIDQDIDELFKYYTEWSRSITQLDKVVIVYVSSYGYTKKLAIEIQKGIQSKGIETCLFDMLETDINVILKEIDSAKGILLGSPTILSDALKPIMELTLHMHPVTHHGKIASAFGSYGWSGEAVDIILTRLKQLRVKVIDGFKIRFNPSVEELQKAFEFGVKFAEEIK